MLGLKMNNIYVFWPNELQCLNVVMQIVLAITHAYTYPAVKREHMGTSQVMRSTSSF